MIPLNACDILVAEQLSLKSGILLFGLDHALILKVRIMTMGSFGPLDSLYRVVYMLKLLYKFKQVYSFKVAYRSDEA